MVLPFLYLALGAPQAIAGLLLPLVTAARLVSEIFVSPYLRRTDRAIPYVLRTNVVSAFALSAIALFAAGLAEGLIALLFVAIALILGLCNGISTIGMSQVYGVAINEKQRDRIIFVQVAIAGIIVIAIVVGSRAIFAGDDPYDQHIVMLWIGIGAIMAACMAIFGTRIFAEFESSNGQTTVVTKQDKEKVAPLSQLAQGVKTAIGLEWFRRFVLARLLFLSVELAMPFYTIHASTFHLGTKHSLSTFVIAAAAGGSFGAVVWSAITRKSIVMTMAIGCAVAAVSATLALGLDFSGYAKNLWAYAVVIFLLSFGCGGVINGRYLYLIGMTEKSERPYLVALGDVAAGLIGIVFATGLGWLAHLQDERSPLIVLAILNVVALFFALLLIRPVAQQGLEAHLYRSPDHQTSPG